jgi:hypothetical protein
MATISSCSVARTNCKQITSVCSSSFRRKCIMSPTRWWAARTPPNRVLCLSTFFRTRKWSLNSQCAPTSPYGMTSLLLCPRVSHGRPCMCFVSLPFLFSSSSSRSSESHVSRRIHFWAPRSHLLPYYFVITAGLRVSSEMTTAWKESKALISTSVAKGDYHKTRCVEKYQQWTATISVWCEMPGGLLFNETNRQVWWQLAVVKPV